MGPKSNLMATLTHEIQEHDVIRLKRPVEGWPSGEDGTVLAVTDRWKLGEIADEQGITLDLLSVRDEDLDLVWKPDRS
jgi:hypothetical protein